MTAMKKKAPIKKKTAAKKKTAVKKPAVKKPAVKKPAVKKTAAAPAGDWRAATLARMRTLILATDPDIIEEHKWKKPSNGMVGVPVWSKNGILCTGEKYAKVVKLTFAKGARLPDPSRLFNSSLEGNMRRAIDIPEGHAPDAGAFQALIRAAVAANRA